MKDIDKTKEELVTKIQELQKEYDVLKSSYKFDVTDRTRVEEAFTVSETRYRRLFETAKDGILILDAETGMIVDVNPFLIELLGYSKDQFIEKAIWEIGFFKDIVANKDNFLELQQKEYIRYEDMPLETADGRMIHVEFVSNVYSVNSHQVIQCNIRDMTDRVRAEKAMIFSETRYRRLFETAKDGILILDAETGMIMDVNPFLIELLGYSKDQFIEKAIWEIGFFKDIVANKDNFLELQQKEYIRYEDMPLETAMGRTIHVEFVSNVYLVDQLKVIQCNIRDMTERVRAERLLSLSNEILGILSRNVSLNDRIAGVLETIQRKTKFSAVGMRLKHGNDFPYFSQFGFSEDFLLTENTLTVKGPDGGMCRDENGDPLLECTCGLVISGKTDSKNPLFTNAGSFWTNDSYPLLELSAFQESIMNSRNKCIHLGYGSVALIPIRTNEKIVGLLQLNEKKKGAFTNDLIVFFEGVCSIIATALIREQAAEELKISKEHAEESDHLKSAFLANMSHEIRTPMNGILGFADLLKEPGLTGEEQKKYISIIEKSGARMLNIINDIVSISKIESGQMEITISETNIKDQIEFIYTFFKPEVERKGIQISIKNALLEKETINTDREKLYAILTNLVKNAIKFTREGSIEIGYEPKGKYLEFFVKDTGEGIGQEQKEIIFERFRQGSELLTRNYEGAGLGLSISKAYVEMLGGKIWVDSELGKGSTFYFTIPSLKSPEEERVSESTAKGDGFENNRIKKLKILIAEDDETSALLLSMAVKLHCKEFLKVRTGVEAVEACRNNPDIDLVLMDIKMPVMDGYTANRQIRQFNKDVVIIAQTAFGLSGDREKALEAGCNDYIPKPFNKAALTVILNKLSQIKTDRPEK
jgi:PAS domain S-box-containing protein